MKEIKGSIDIDAPVAKVWGVLTDLKAYPQWNPFMTQLSGDLKEGSVLDVVVKIPGRKDTKFKTQLVKMVEKKEALFKGAIIKGLLTSDHLITLESLGENKTRLFQSITFKGLMSSLAGGTIRDSQKGLDLMNSAAKVRSEGTGK
jgi:hypothetical protein